MFPKNVRVKGEDLLHNFWILQFDIQNIFS
jgi:hypothetical protein